jgi:hypothetical protein
MPNFVSIQPELIILQFTFPFFIAPAERVPERYVLNAHRFLLNIMFRTRTLLLTASHMIATASIAIFAPYFFLAFHTLENVVLIVPTQKACVMACFCSGDRFTP